MTVTTALPSWFHRRFTNIYTNAHAATKDLSVVLCNTSVYSVWYHWKSLAGTSSIRTISPKRSWQRRRALSIGMCVMGKGGRALSIKSYNKTTRRRRRRITPVRDDDDRPRAVTFGAVGDVLSTDCEVRRRHRVRCEREESAASAAAAVMHLYAKRRRRRRDERARWLRARRPLYTDVSAAARD